MALVPAFISQFVPIPALAVLLTSLPLHTILEKMAEKDLQDKANEATENTADFSINADENLSGTTHLNEPISEESDVEKAKKEAEEAKDRYLRLAAEFDNFKRRNAKERIELIQTAGKDVITDMLEVLDDADRAQQQLDNAAITPEVKEGIQLIFNKLRNKLQARGLKAMETAGKDFDADLQEAIAEIPAPTEALKGKIVDEILKGYYLNDKLIRHAKVVVGK